MVRRSIEIIKKLKKLKKKKKLKTELLSADFNKSNIYFLPTDSFRAHTGGFFLNKASLISSAASFGNFVLIQVTAFFSGAFDRFLAEKHPD